MLPIPADPATSAKTAAAVSRLRPRSDADQQRPTTLDWDRAVAAAQADPDLPALVAQPIISLAEGVVAGYEALSRFPPVAGRVLAPDLWFAEADARGVAAELEARVVGKALELRDTLPVNRFLTVNVSPHLLDAPALQRALFSGADLTRLVVELTEHTRADPEDRFVRDLDRLRERGATIALDDAGSGYSGLQQLAALRPQLVKLDRSLVDHIDEDEVKLALAQTLGTFVGRMDGWLLAEGVERLAEMHAICRLGLPLAQGYLFGRPAPGWSELDCDLALQLRLLRHVQVDHPGLSDLLEVAATATGVSQARVAVVRDDLSLVVVIDENEVPQRLVLRDGRTEDITVRTALSTSPADAAHRAMARDQVHRFSPLVCTDDTGRHLGIVRIERLVQFLARAQDRRGPADDQS